ncbi:hypothetical protein OHC33_000084 [Knufia fluminis]|uniref:NAD(P)-binding protein n=1 Tax=Knufia fluminis TaxID=191047 RepID=A0AAN8ET73_9EURO|nr:hypothetical protein OHC33_000084 [Knufia fluminis]
MSLSVLTDSDVKEILQNLTYDDVIDLQKTLGDALHGYSTGDTNASCCASFQPERTVLKKKDVTSLFIPSSAGDAIGVKVVTMQTPVSTKPPSSASAGESVTSKKSSGSVSSASTGIDALQLTPASTTSTSTSTGDTNSTTTRSSISSASSQPPSTPTTQTTPPKGIINIMDSHGTPLGILPATELPAFTTSLASTLLLRRRQTVHTLTIFGAGRIAFYTILLSLLLRAPEIHHINIINRSFDNAIALMKQFLPSHGGDPSWSHVKFSALSPEFVEYDRLLKEEVRKADVVFCCTPSTTPLFPAEYLTSHEGRRKGRYIAAVGSYMPHMIELHPQIIQAAVKDGNHKRHHHRHARQEGVIVVDSLDGCLRGAGEVVSVGLTGEQLVEIGELIMVRRSLEEEKKGEGEKGLVEWLTRGNVIYKGVGLGLMDLVVGREVVRLGRERGVGTVIAEF